MNRYLTITEARTILELPETATMEVIKSSYRSLLYRWHPDRCEGDPEECHEMTRRIIWAYQTILDYCQNYQYSFSEEAVKRHRSPQEWWLKRFGDDPVWGGGRKPE